MARPNKFKNVKYGKNQKNSVGVIPKFVLKVHAFLDAQLGFCVPLIGFLREWYLK